VPNDVAAAVGDEREFRQVARRRAEVDDELCDLGTARPEGRTDDVDDDAVVIRPLGPNHDVAGVRHC
jgi:hypothetical protein